MNVELDQTMDSTLSLFCGGGAFKVEPSDLRPTVHGSSRYALSTSPCSQPLLILCPAIGTLADAAATQGDADSLNVLENGRT